MYRIIALVKKEFLSIFKDRKSRTVIVVPPLVQLVIFAYAATYDLERVRFAVYNEDRSSLSRELTARFEGSAVFLKIGDIQRHDQIASWIDAKKVLMVVHLGPNFSASLRSGKPAGVQLIIDGRNSNTALIALNYARDIVTTYSRLWNRREMEGPLSATLEVRSWYNPNLKSQWYIVPAILGVMTLLVTMLVTALSVAREREQGTFDQLLVTPLRPVEILVGKSIPGMLIGLGEGTACLVIAVVWFEIPFRGSLIWLYAGLTLFLLSAVGIGLMISSMAVTQQQGLLGAFLFMVPAVILSGFTTPIDNMPAAIAELTRLNPLRYFIVVLRGSFLESAPAGLLLQQLWPMALIGLCTLATAGWLFRHRSQ